jgi:hypothetical protein
MGAWESEEEEKYSGWGNQSNYIDLDEENKTENKGKIKIFALEVLFLMSEFTNTDHAKRTGQIMNYSTHPRQLAKKLTSSQGSSKGSGETLESCLDQFRTVEKLSASDSWYCGKCKVHVEATKKLELYTTAPYLVMSLNRFK